ncbi:carboxy-S-adenosyl-L-methionine synthase CmoA [Desulfobulbus alkaliphilus]|uniref:carboxy-S-adenosyl-L-methionine synthase CmoA n=1 Tax=Desulfobulbus alkaliphilus TaxID=869814 RepID=UPI001962ED17|nr:carboxy-S-adenosyl-L-methionine synthase CmoA [Desulfobulbus alkaliphilus]MBM9537223.1 carboxy-S-adenosyl-L-methionine synthase CmoA [Desulfobulbus alkaliphilus]
MTEDNLYAAGRVDQDFSFNDRVAEVFDDMLERSIPFYRTVMDCMAQLLVNRLPEGATLYDLGSSTGTTLLELTRRMTAKKVHYIGIDNAPAMVAKARQKSAQYGKSEMLQFRLDDITRCPLPDASAIICNYTMQFLRPMTRQVFIERLYRELSAGGILILSEKTIAAAGRLNRDFIEQYHAFKMKQGYSELEISAKREALENVLVPFSVDENIAMLRHAGFEEIEIFFKWFNFTSMVALKQP